MSNFRPALIAAAEEAARDGQITRSELFKIRILSLFPRKLAELEECCTAQAVSTGVAQNAGAIDWAALLEFIKGLLPIILQILQIFAVI